MARFLVTETLTELRFYRIGKDNRPMTVVRQRLYNTSEELFTADVEGSVEICPYDLEGTQPKGSGEYLDPDVTKAKLDISKAANTQTSARVGGLIDKVLSKGIGLLVIGIIAWGLIGGIIAG